MRIACLVFSSFWVYFLDMRHTEYVVFLPLPHLRVPSWPTDFTLWYQFKTSMDQKFITGRVLIDYVCRLRCLVNSFRRLENSCLWEHFHCNVTSGHLAKLEVSLWGGAISGFFNTSMDEVLWHQWVLWPTTGCPWLCPDGALSVLSCQERRG